MTAPQDAIERTLAAYNGKETATLEALLGEGVVDDAAIEHLVDRIPAYDANAEVGATWLLLEALKNGARLNGRTQTAYLEAMSHLKRSESKLHMARAIEFLSLSDEEARTIAEQLQFWTVDKAAFLRAWSVTALVHLGQSHPALKTAADAVLEQEKNDPAASVRARLRQLGVK